MNRPAITPKAFLTADGTILAHVDNTHHALIDDEVYFLQDFHELSAIAERSVRMGYNAVVQCCQGRIELEMGGEHRNGSHATVQSKRICVESGQILLLPANKLLQPMMVSTDVDVSVLLVSDKVLHEVLGPHITLWNRAMFLEEIYVIDGGIWIDGARNYARTLFGEKGSPEQFLLFRDIVMSFLRTMFLMICEILTRQNKGKSDGSSNDNLSLGERSIFDHFLGLLSSEPVKRQQVSYYAAQLNITPKYLSTVCKRVSGKSPMRWITESVMDEVYDMLRNTNLSVKEISHRMRFPNSSFFGQYFREQTGMTPLEYRNKVKMVRK